MQKYLGLHRLLISNTQFYMPSQTMPADICYCCLSNNRLTI